MSFSSTTPLRETDPPMLVKTDPQCAQSIVGWNEVLKGVAAWKGEVIR